MELSYSETVGECPECHEIFPEKDLVFNYPYLDKPSYPIFYQGVWCKICSDKIDVSDIGELKSHKGTLIVVGG